MTLLIIGLLLWVAGHLWGRFLPDAYKQLGKAAYAVSAVVIVASVLAMIVGYRGADMIVLWDGPSFLKHINNLLMLLAFYVYFQTVTQPGTAWIMGNTRHPQLTGFKIWTVAHLLVNGDVASIVLFGGLLAWAVLEVILINKQGEKFDRSKAPVKSPWIHLALVLVIFVLVAVAHTALGYSPFGG